MSLKSFGWPKNQCYCPKNSIRALSGWPKDWCEDEIRYFKLLEGKSVSISELAHVAGDILSISVSTVALEYWGLVIWQGRIVSN